MLKQWRIVCISVTVIVISVFLVACGSDTSTGSSTPTVAGCATGNITAAGSTALAPLVQAVAKVYQNKCTGANITVNLGGSGSGLSQVEAGNIQIGNSDIFKKAGQDDLVDHQVAVVAFALIINPKVTGVTNLTTDQIKGIYSGRTTNWKDLGGPDLKIVVVSRPASSGTRATFQQYILGGPETISSPANLTSDSTSTVVTNVRQTDGAIGYAALGATKVSGLTMLSIDGNAPTVDMVKTNAYKFWNIEHMYTKGEATGLTKSFIDFMATSDARQEATTLDFIAIADMTQDAIQAHQPK
ncbi:MAG TPA: phosphate ABC transporter substrate-binding protein [Ktedonobacteraceae bacterium]|nr:phosphate ABC transporter substrate-binding protein [Ktedonobacteraceae bacterium]